MKIGIIGSGDVARALGSGFLKHGYDVMLGTRNPEKLEEWYKLNPSAKIGTFEEAAHFAEIGVLAVKGTVALNAMQIAGEKNMSGKPVIDVTNPVADLPPENGVLAYFTDFRESLLEKLQKTYTSVKFVKAFNSVGNAFMVNPQFPGGKPTMFICGNNSDSKKKVSFILDQFGWEVADMGKMESARAIEPLCMLWCIPGFLENNWKHAFKFLKQDS